MNADDFVGGHSILALERFMDETRHMIIFDVLSWKSPVGEKGERLRLFLSDMGYAKAQASEKRGEIKIRNLSLKAKGLLSMMLSLPDEWNYTTRGLAAICKEGVDAIGKTLKELELAGYIIRRQLRGKDGRISDTEYTIFEKPRKPSPPDTTLPDTENPYLDNPDTEAPDTDNPAQLNTKKSNTQKSNTDLSSTHSFFLPAADGMMDGFEKKAEIREQIEYDILCQQYDRMQLDELVEIMLEVAMNRSPTVKIGRDAEYPTGFVQQRFEKITSMHVEKVMDGIRENTTRVWNTKAYLILPQISAR